MILRGIKRAVRSSLNHAYRRIQVDPKDYLQRIRRTYGLPIQSFQDMFSVPEKTVEYEAEQTISASATVAAIEGAGRVLGGMLRAAPAIGTLSPALRRMLQKLSLI